MTAADACSLPLRCHGGCCVGPDAALAHTGAEHALSFASGFSASLHRPRPHAGDGGGRPVGRPERRARAVGLAGGVRRRDGAGRRARHRRHCPAAGGIRHPRLRGRAGAAGAGGGSPAGRRSGRRWSRPSPCCTVTRTAPSFPAMLPPPPTPRASRSPPRSCTPSASASRASPRARSGRLLVRGAGALVAAAGVALARRLGGDA